jgi:hypothetical protein
MSASPERYRSIESDAPMSGKQLDMFYADGWRLVCAVPFWKAGDKGTRTQMIAYHFEKIESRIYTA